MKHKGTIRAAFIFSMLPGSMKSRITGTLPHRLLQKLDSGLGKTEALTLKEKNLIYRKFIEEMKIIKNSREHTLNISLAGSLAVLALLVAVTFTTGLIMYGNAGRIVRFLELVLANGGFHLVIAPCLAGYLYSHLRTNPLKILFISDNYFIDILLSFFSGILITLPVFLSIKPPGPAGISTFIEIFTCIVSLTIVPATEEIFFRYIIFFKGGRKYGFLLTGLFSSILFSAVHAPGTGFQFAAYMGAGILLCILVSYRKSIFPAFISHSLSNLLLNLLQ
jgi:membrane protease YdiL (CAAX protease family)